MNNETKRISYRDALAVQKSITPIIDKCYLRVGIAMLPWNREAPDRLQVPGQNYF